MKYDIFLAGPWEKHALIPYKRKIKEAFPNNHIFDPEERLSQKTGEWFKDNYNALKSSKSLVSLVPDFPFSGNSLEVGIYYQMHSKNQDKPLEQIIVIWPEEVKPDYGKEVAKHIGYVVENIEEAIIRLKDVLK